ncbi:hypothetical protein PS623_03419 [Pseudomonas fluorescens]|nr:hypothetical protein PS623_03419 [Pseudomonas fluorescens]
MASMKYGLKAKLRPTKLSRLSQLEPARVLPLTSIRYITSAPVWRVMSLSRRLALVIASILNGSANAWRSAGSSPRICGKVS